MVTTCEMEVGGVGGGGVVVSLNSIPIQFSDCISLMSQFKEAAVHLSVYDTLYETTVILLTA